MLYSSSHYFFTSVNQRHENLNMAIVRRLREDQPLRLLLNLLFLVILIALSLLINLNA